MRPGITICAEPCSSSVIGAARGHFRADVSPVGWSPSIGLRSVDWSPDGEGSGVFCGVLQASGRVVSLEWVWWWNNQRLHGELDMRTPLEVENAY